jgi:hypothetical protein
MGQLWMAELGPLGRNRNGAQGVSLGTGLAKAYFAIANPARLLTTFGGSRPLFQHFCAESVQFFGG